MDPVTSTTTNEVAHPGLLSAGTFQLEKNLITAAIDLKPAFDIIAPPHDRPIPALIQLLRDEKMRSDDMLRVYVDNARQPVHAGPACLSNSDLGVAWQLKIWTLNGLINLIENTGQVPTPEQFLTVEEEGKRLFETMMEWVEETKWGCEILIYNNYRNHEHVCNVCGRRNQAGNVGLNGY